MSSCLILYQNDKLYMSSDTSSCANINGELVRVSNNAEKIKIIGNYIVFTSGNLVLCNKCFDFLESISSENNISYKLSCHLKTISNTKNRYDLEIVIGFIKNSNIVVHQISSYNNYELVEYIGSDGGINVLASGSNNDKLSNYVCRNFNDNIIDLYKNSYRHINDEVVGGAMNLYYLDIYKKTPKLITTCVIDEYINPIFIKPDNIHYVLAQNLVGKMILGNELGIYSEDGSAEMEFSNFGLRLNTKSDASGLYQRILDIQRDGISQLYIDSDGNIVLATDQFIQTVEAIDRLNIKYADIENLYVSNATIEKLLAEYAKIKDLEAINGKFETIVANKAEIDELLAGNITVAGKLKAAEAEIGTLKATSITVGELDAYKATIEKLFALYASIEYLEANYITAQKIETTYLKAASLDAINATIENLKADVATIGSLVADKADIEDLNVANAKIETLIADFAKISTLVAEKVDAKYVEAEIIKANQIIVEDLEALHAVVDTLETKYATIDMLNAKYAEIELLIAKKASIEELQAAVADIGILNAGMANIESILAGNIGTGLLQAIHLTAKNVVIDDAVIKDLIAGKITVADLKAGNISTNYMTISSDDGSLSIAGNTMQFKDNLDRVRLQIGKDALGNFNFIVFGEDGTTAVYDQNGITKHAVPDGLIVDDMVAGDANISGSKLERESLIDKINADGSKTISSSKVWIDEENQSLGASFTEIKESVGSTVEDLTTYINATNKTLEGMQGQIDGSIMTWFYQYVPTNTNAPASDWTTTDLKNNHLGDLFYNTITGYCYRYQVQNNIHSWQRITDTDITKALEEASKAQDTADSKRRVFTITPTPPYDIGDLWSQGVNGELMRCKVSKSASQTYASADWEKASKYTDDTKANAVDSKVTTLQTEFTVEQGKISSLIKETEVITEKVTEVEGTANDALTSADSANNKIDGMSIGARNLALGTSKEILKSRECTYPITDVVYEKDAYTLSFYAKSEVSGQANLSIEDTTGSDRFGYQLGKVNLTTSYQRHVKTIVSPYNYSGDVKGIVARVVGDTTNVLISIKELKFERGNKRTDWTPAPEDLQDQVDANINDFDVEYYLSTSATSVIGGSWSTDAPIWANGRYMWSRTKKTFANGTSTTTDPVCIAGGKGSDGKGVKSFVEEYYKSTSSTTQTDGSWSITPPTWESGKYIWTRSVITYTDNTVHTTSPICVTGSKGEQGIQGGKGADGRTSYTHIAYSNSADGTTDFSVSDSNRDYVGMYVDFTVADSTDHTKYAWSKIKGANGENGVAGAKGEDGRTPYFHIAYANNATGTSGFSVSDSSNKLYIGQYTDFIQADSTDPTKYSWTKIKGEDGVAGTNGKDGVGVKTITNYYLATASGSGVTSSTAGWTTAVQSVTSTKKYLWNYEVVTYTNNTTAQTTPCIIGAYGDTGNTGGQGADGVGISSIVEYYQISTSGTAVPTSWLTTVPTMTPTNKYLWNYEIITYTNNTKKETLKRVIGVYGNTGAQGAQGVGYKSVTEYYQVSTSSTTAPTSWITTVPTMTATNKYLWNYEVITYTDNSTFTTLKRVIGVYGDKGNTGGTGATGNGVSTITNYYLTTASGSGVTTATTGWSTTPTATTTTNKYLWNYEVIKYTNGTSATSTPCIIGTHGATGNTGAAGKDGVSLSKVEVLYYLSTSNTTQTGGSWATTAPAWVDGKYIWSKQRTTLSNASTTETAPVCITGGKGSSGTNGAVGQGVSSINTEFYLSTSKTTQAGGSWIATMPTWSAGKYLWTRSKVVYKNPTATTYTTPVCDSSWEAVNELEKTVTTLTDKYNETVKTVEGNTTTIGNVKTSVSDLSGKVVALDSKVLEIKQTADGVSTTVTANKSKWDAASTNASNALGKIDGLEIGGRNLWILTDLVAGYETGGSITPNANTAHQIMNTLISLDGAKSITIQVWNPNKLINAGNTNRVAFYNSSKTYISSSTTLSLNGEVHRIQTITVPTNASYMRVGMICGVTAVDETVKVKVEKGNKPTDWTQSPEDAENAIQVGGRNLLVASKIASYVSYNTITDKVSTEHIKSKWIASYTGNMFTLNVHQYTPPKGTHTLSGYIKVNNAIPTSKYFTGLASTYGNNLKVNHYDSKTGYFYITQDYNGASIWILHATTTRKSGSADTVELMRLKFENGNKPTDWTESPEDIDNNIQIGGRNILKGSKDGWSLTGSDYSNVVKREGTKVTTLLTSTGNAYCWIQNTLTMPVIEFKNFIGESFSYSVDVRVTGSFKNLRLSVDVRGGSTIGLIVLAPVDDNCPKGEWIRVGGVSRMVDKGVNMTNCLLGVNWNSSTVGSTCEYRLVKFEKGSKPTDWSPAPEDVEKDIEETKTIATQTADKFSWIVKSGTSSTNFELTDRTATLVANNINLKGLVTFSGLNSDAQGKINTATSTANTAKSTADTAKKTADTATLIAKAMTKGRCLFLDTDFRSGTNSVNIYNNNHSAAPSAVTSTRIAKPADCPTTSTHCMEIKLVGGASPHYGGFHQTYNGRINSITVQRFIAKLPVGYYFNPANNSLGTGGINKFVGSNSGTGKYEEYICVTTFGTGGTISNAGYVSISGSPTPTATKPVYCYIASCTAYDITNSNPSDAWASDAIINGTTTINGGYIKTQTIKTDQLDVNNIFATGNAIMNIINAQDINANRITSGEIKADYVSLYGMQVLNKDTDIATLTVESSGDISMRGSVESYNFDSGISGWSINRNGDAEFNDVTVRGSLITNDGGIVTSGGAGINLIPKTDETEISLGKFPTTGYSEGKTYNTTTILLGDQYVMSFDAKSTVEKDIIVCHFYNPSNITSVETSTGYKGTGTDGYALITLTSQWTRYWIKYKMPPNTDTKLKSIIIGRRHAGKGTGSISVRLAKLEKGDKATAWSPAPEDSLKQVRFWAGSTFAERESAPFKVYNDGSMVAQRGTFSGVFTGDVQIGNISIIDPTSTAGNDAILTIQNGSTGIKQVQLSDSGSSMFAQNVYITDNFYNNNIKLLNDGSVIASNSIMAGDENRSVQISDESININGSTINNNGQYLQLISDSVSIGTTKDKANLLATGNVNVRGQLFVNNGINFNNVISCIMSANGMDFNFIDTAGSGDIIITYNSNGGTAIGQQLAWSGGKIIKPTNPTRTNYTFVAWCADSALTKNWDFANDLAYENTTLYAKWKYADPVAPNVKAINYTVKPAFEGTFSLYVAASSMGVQASMTGDGTLSYSWELYKITTKADPTTAGKRIPCKTKLTMAEKTAMISFSTFEKLYDQVNIDTWYNSDAHNNKWGIDKTMICGYCTVTNTLNSKTAATKIFVGEDTWGGLEAYEKALPELPLL